MRVDLYTVIHKAQRQRLFELSVKIGRTDFDDSTQVTKVREELQKMIAHLRKHAHTDETFIHPLFNKVGQEGQLLEEEHHALENSFDELEIIGASSNARSKLYVQFNRFLAAYLQHIDEEEVTQVEILWKHFNDQELMEVMKNFQQSLTPQENAAGLEFVLPCLSVPEVINMLSKIQNTAPLPAFQAACAITENAFSTTEWEGIKKALSIPSLV
ncbi:MAG: hemerythrin domain-containing protein [Gammaproteobacteria bacterium]